MPTYELRDFHIDVGPSSLFERVRFKLQKLRSLKNMRPFKDRGPRALQKALSRFNSSDWQLISAGVRDDTGKFVTSTWRRVFENKCWQLVIGYEGIIVSLSEVSTPQTDLTDQYIKRGTILYNFVEQVSHELMVADGQAVRSKPSNEIRAELVFGQGKVPAFFLIGLPT